MSLKRLGFLLVILNVTFLCLSGKQIDRSCVRFHWNDLHFSFSPRNTTFWKEAVWNITNYCLLQTNSSLLYNNKTCKRRPIKVTFPVISLNPNITFKMLPRPVMVMKELSPSTTSQVVQALGQIWKLFAFCLMASALSGIMIWFFVSCTVSISHAIVWQLKYCPSLNCSNSG